MRTEQVEQRAARAPLRRLPAGAEVAPEGQVLHELHVGTFTWGRDTMSSLEGLALATGRGAEGGSILRAFARHVRDGLIPNLFPAGNAGGLYHTAAAGSSSCAPAASRCSIAP